VIETNHNEEAVHMQVSTIGLDLAKNVVQVDGIDANDNGSRSSSDTYLFVFWFQTLHEGFDAPDRLGLGLCILRVF